MTDIVDVPSPDITGRQEEVNISKNLLFIAAIWLEQEICNLEGQASNLTGKKSPNLIFEEERIEKREGGILLLQA